MPANHLEQLVAEWYEYQGYFVRQNVMVGKLPKGGYECELDIVCFHPESRKLVHLEPSNDALSWEKREVRFRKKFRAGRKYIPDLFKGLQIPDEIDQIAVLGFASKATHTRIGGGRILLVSELLEEIFSSLKGQRMFSSAVPEHLPILRSFQLVAEFRKQISRVWEGDGRK